ncbi:hypothetical protein ANO11243_091130 [Dothideomycetidae sp. 11243]|nr:hypothetical protein ANO11243_091130 [fungal sp. No.11243]
MPEERPIRIAIVGAGIAGLTLANALLRKPKSDAAENHPGFEVHVYEAKPGFTGRGWGIGLAGNAQKALNYCAPEVLNKIVETSASVARGTVTMIGSGKYAGTEVMTIAAPVTTPQDAKEGETKKKVGAVGVYRKEFINDLKELYEKIGDKDSLHFGKELASVVVGAEEAGVDLSFTDGSSEHFDAVIGADGYRSVVRKHVLGEKKAEEQAATRAGFWNVTTVVPMEVAKETLYKPLRESLRRDNPDDQDKVDAYFGENHDLNRPSTWAWVGGSFTVLSSARNNKDVGILLAGVEEEPWKERKQLMTRDMIKKLSKGWTEGPYLTPLLDTLFHDEPEIYGYNHWHFPKTSTYNNGRLCVIGDAAHATTPWQASGAAISIEDAMIMSHLLWNISNPSQLHLSSAFEAFTEVRIDRCQHVIESSDRMGKLMCGLNPDAGSQNPDTGYFEFEPTKMKGLLTGRWDKIWNVSQEDHRQDAKMRLERKIAEGTAE